jgi:hypothetical protein
MRKTDLGIPAMVFVGLLFWLLVLRPAFIRPLLDSLLRYRIRP